MAEANQNQVICSNCGAVNASNDSKCCLCHKPLKNDLTEEQKAEKRGKKVGKAVKKINDKMNSLQKIESGGASVVTKSAKVVETAADVAEEATKVATKSGFRKFVSSSVFGWTAVGILGGVSGWAIGDMIVSMNTPEEIISYDDNEILDNIDDIMQKYTGWSGYDPNTSSRPIYDENQNEVYPWDDNPILKNKKVAIEEFLDPCEAMQVAFELLRIKPTYLIETTGLVKPGVSVAKTQNITSVRIKDEYYQQIGRYMFESETIGTVSTSTRFIGTKDNIEEYTRKSSSNDDGIIHSTYKDKANASYTDEEFADKFGTNIYNPCIYKISSKTTLIDDEHHAPSYSFDEETGHYTISLSLSKKAMTDYIKQMIATDDMVINVKPFNYTTLTITTNAMLYPLSLNVKEDYSTVASIGIKITAPCTAEMTSLYYYDSIEFPSDITESYHLRIEK